MTITKNRNGVTILKDSRLFSAMEENGVLFSLSYVGSVADGFSMQGRKVNDRKIIMQALSLIERKGGKF